MVRRRDAMGMSAAMEYTDRLRSLIESADAALEELHLAQDARMRAFSTRLSTWRTAMALELAAYEGGDNEIVSVNRERRPHGSS